MQMGKNILLKLKAKRVITRSKRPDLSLTSPEYTSGTSSIFSYFNCFRVSTNTLLENAYSSTIRIFLDDLFVKLTPKKNEFQPIGKIWHIVPEGPADPNSLIDACIAFAPKLFEDCPSLEDVKASLKDETMLDFDIGKDDIPAKWSELREEARPIFEKLDILKGELRFFPASSGR